ncbi:winged helix-turn-helix transcriptional regulator [Chitinophaga flava]|uniref:Transcriptional regulator n=1 Tax=Chitinophaga flava TaxID=2259036 RepID=A0A365XVE5_9BACT|nr:helix-turn-helix domain-containing protein [Chitinophaga flava]RBL90293.1 transcriptional regulator [Chitinophaga flava]
MTAIKENSTYQQNKAEGMLNCPVCYIMDKIGGQWKPSIIYHLLPGPKRYGQLKKDISSITEKMLTQSLKQLENDGLVKKHPGTGPFSSVFYELTEEGHSLLPVVQAMALWAISNSKRMPYDPYGILKDVL